MAGLEPYAVTSGFDLEQIAQRVLKLAEIATLEHLESLMNSQASDVLELVRLMDAE